MWFVDVQTDWQFGAGLVETVRPGTTQRAVARSLQRWLFDASVPGVSRVDATTVYEEALASFTAILTQATDGHAIPQRLLAAALGSGTQAEDRFDALFGLTVHALCHALSSYRVQLRVTTMEDAALASAVEPGPGAGTDNIVDEEDRGGPDQSLAVSTLKALLPRWTVRSGFAEQGQAPDAADEIRWERPFATAANGDCFWVAKASMLAAIRALPWVFKLGEQVTRNEGDGVRTEQPLLAGNAAIGERIDRLLQELPTRLTPQPARLALAYLREQEKASVDDGSSDVRVPLLGFRRQNDFLRQFLADEAIHGTLTSATYRAYIAAVDIQQAVPWRLDADVLRLAKDFGQAALRFRRGDDDALGNGAWAAEVLYTRKSDTATFRNAAPGDWLDNKLVKSSLDDLCANAGVSFFLPWKADYRGRIYAATPWLTPQGNDLQRALFRFERGRTLSGEGRQALMRHGGGLVSKSVLLAGGGSAATQSRKERWVQEHRAEIVRWAQAPLLDAGWRKVTEKPLQFLAFCRAFADVEADPGYEVRLPIQIDGTCNGLQHIAALMGDEELARHVNVIAAEGDAPGDVYSALAQVARDYIGHRESGARRNGSLEQGFVLTDRWLAQTLRGSRLMTRGAAKKVVMTVPYGAGIQAQSSDMLEHLRDAIADDPLTAEELAHPAAVQLLQWVGTNKQAQRFVRDFKPGRRLDPTQQAQAPLLAFVASTLVVYLRSALAARFPSVNRFSSWLVSVAEHCGDLPLVWVTPLGLPVVQDGFVVKAATTPPVRLAGAEPTTVGFDVLTEEVDRAAQRRALLPNLIHSFDASHLARTLNAAAQAGIHEIGSIHDCLLCHPNDAPTLAQTVWNEFVGLYVRDKSTGWPVELRRWSEWMRWVSDLAVSPAPSDLNSWVKGDAGNLRPPRAPTNVEDCELAVRELVKLLRDKKSEGGAGARLAAWLERQGQPDAVSWGNAANSKWRSVAEWKEGAELCNHFASVLADGKSTHDAEDRLEEVRSRLWASQVPAYKKLTTHLGAIEWWLTALAEQAEAGGAPALIYAQLKVVRDVVFDLAKDFASSAAWLRQCRAGLVLVRMKRGNVRPQVGLALRLFAFACSTQRLASRWPPGMVHKGGRTGRWALGGVALDEWPQLAPSSFELDSSVRPTYFFS